MDTSDNDQNESGGPHFRRLERSVLQLREDRNNFSVELLVKVGKIESGLNNLQNEVNKLSSKDIEITNLVTSQADSFRRSLLELTDKFTKQLEELGAQALKRQDIAWIKSVVSILLGAALTAGVTYFVNVFLGKHF